MPAATLRILARNIESDGFATDFAAPFALKKIRIANFSVQLIDSQDSLNYARKFFDGAMIGECIVECEYDSIPPAPMDEDWAGFGGMPWDAEDLLLELRLFRPGDLAFASVSLEKPGQQPQRLYPYRVISCLVPNSTTRPFVLNRDEASAFDQFAESIRSAQSWRSKWFEVCRRYFLYGGSTEFNPNFAGEVDRVMDFTTALEAALVPESDMVSRRLRKRAVQMLALTGNEGGKAEKLLKDFYSVRSTLVHGNSLSPDQLSLLQERDRWSEFEDIVRRLIVAAVRAVPAQDPQRASYLAALYDPSDTERADLVLNEFGAMTHTGVKRDLLCRMLNRM